MQRNGIINTIIKNQTWHWAEFPRNSDWPGLLNESRFWERLNKGGLPLGQVREIIKKWIYNYNLDHPDAALANYHRYAIDTACKKFTLGVSTF
jgi:hypothetical protein